MNTFENRNSRHPKVVQKWNFDFLANFQVILNNFCFCGNVDKITFWTTFERPKILLLPIFALYRVTVRGVRSDHF